ncbi:MAG: aminotransferase class V-fold PLP-dependent enzyme, partial [Gammaproteobacteria bacterium]|nr:aminotransferase class V-fold PLP-dependent enzyme [Gammaproteobacteria bacterium]
MTWQHEFPLDEGIYYLNHAAVSPWPVRTAKAVSEFARENTVYGASRYPEWVKTESLLREQLRKLINAPSTESIALLKNTSEAISVVAEGLKWKHGDNVVSTSQEFPSNRFPWQAQADKGVEFREANLESGASPEQALIDACDRNTRVMAISSVQYGSGLKLDLEVLGQYCRGKDILFCVDAIQSLGAHTLDVQACHADFVMADAHKWMMGPEGIALFYCRDDWIDRLELHQYGWHMVENAGNYDQREWNPAPDARRFECGSPNMLGIHALSASLSLIEEVGM